MEEGETRDRLIGSSVLPFAVDSRWNCIYFLLAQERVVPGWSGSQTWSDFGGSAVGAADAPQTAAREFVEESMGVIKFSERHATPYTDYKPVEDAIAQGAYALSITFTMPERSSKYVTYIKQLKFDRHAVRTHHDLYCALRQKHAGIEAVGRSPRHPLLEPGRPVPDGYLEKSALRWWSIPQLNAALRRTRGGDDRLRLSFSHRLRVILKEFPADGRIVAVGPRWEHVFPLTTYHNLTIKKKDPRDGDAPVDLQQRGPG